MKMKKLAGASASAIAIILYANNFASVSAAQPDLSAPADQAAIEFDIPAQPLPDALIAFSLQSGQTVLSSPETTGDKRSSAVKGQLAPADALRAILRSSGLKYRRSAGQNFLVTASLSASAPARLAGALQDGAARPASNGGSLIPAAVAESPDPVRETGEATRRDEVIVTGTNIRGVLNPASPLFIFDRDAISRSGAATTQDFIRTLPQNLDTSSSSANSLAGSTPGFGGASAAINIRGLGNNATLTLVNGRRLPSSAGTSDFVDISLIPLAAIERVELLTDGASAIYGADAVAGVVNFVLRDDYDGAETRLRAGGVAEGGYQQYQASQTIGRSWADGNAMASYEFLRQNKLGANDRPFTASAADPTDLAPRQTRHSILANARQQVGAVRFTATGLMSLSDSTVDQVLFGGGNVHEDASNRQFGGSAGAETAIGGAWRAQLTGSFMRNETVTMQFDDAGLDLDLDASFNLWTADFIADGPLFEAPGGPARMAVGGHFRAEDYRRMTLTPPAAAPKNVRLDRKAYAVFGEANIPLIGEGNRSPGLHALELSAAGRFEHFSDAGSSANPKVGFRYAPHRDISLRGTFGTSFKAPNFIDLGLAETVSALPGFIFPAAPGAAAPNPDLIVLGGGNTGLRPERSQNWTAGLDVTPAFAGGLDFSFTYFDIRFDDRIGAPGPSPFSVFVTPAAFGEFVLFDPSAEEIAAFFSDPRLQNPFGVTPASVGVVLDTRFENIASTTVRGVDFAAAYVTDIAAGELHFDLSGSYLLEYSERASAAADRVETLNTVFNPVDLRFRASAGWRRDGYGATVFVTYVDDYSSTETGPRVPVDSWTTVDLDFRLNPAEAFGAERLRGTELSLHIQNLFNEPPPFVDLALDNGIDFDGANANALGRFIALTVVKQW